MAAGKQVKVSPAEFREVDLGASKAHVRRALGKPERTGPDPRATSEYNDCWFYSRTDGAAGDVYLCFKDDKVSIKVIEGDTGGYLSDAPPTT